MIENRPDWCVSRQRVWGIPIMVFYCAGCGEPLVTQETIQTCRPSYLRRRGRTSGLKRRLSGFSRRDSLCAMRRERVQKGDGYPRCLVRLRGVLGRGLGEAGRPEIPASLYLEGSDQHRGWFHSSLLTSVGTRGMPLSERSSPTALWLMERGKRCPSQQGMSWPPMRSSEIWS